MIDWNENFRSNLGGQLMNVNAQNTEAIPWKVYFYGGFWGHHGRDHAGTEIPVNHTFDWEGEEWFVPAVYACGQGLVMDLFCKVSKEDVEVFAHKWNLSPESRSDDFDQELVENIEAENPLNSHFRPSLMLNGKELPLLHTCGMAWNPVFPEGNDPETKAVLAHYGFAPSFGWNICRAYFSWATKKKPRIKCLQLTLNPLAVPVPGPHFTVQKPGDSFSFTHPITGTTHTLTVQSLEPLELDEKALESEPFGEWLFPSHGLALYYKISPGLPDRAVTVTDCVSSDAPIHKGHASSGFEARPSGCAAIGIIGGADGPTSIFLAGKETQPKGGALACSALHFQPVSRVEWRIVFHEKRKGSITTLFSA